MIDADFAAHFAADWIAAWNSHDLDRILAHYSDDFEMSSPVIVQIAGEPSGRLKGKAAVGAYWAKALEILPELHFELVITLVGVDSITLYYQGARGMAAEVFFFDTERKDPERKSGAGIRTLRGVSVGFRRRSVPYPLRIPATSQA